MTRIRRLTIAALLLAAALLPAGPARAGSLLAWLHHDDCPAPSYTPFRYWTPGLARVSDCVHGPTIDVYPPDTHPEVPPTFIILPYHCPAVPPAETVIDVPSPQPDPKAK